jgi:hypothetical protein
MLVFMPKSGSINSGTGVSGMGEEEEFLQLSETFHGEIMIANILNN